MKVAVIGAGSWGTALAQHLAQSSHSVRLWAHSQDTAEVITSEHYNPRYLSDTQLSTNIVATADVRECLDDVQAIVVVTPSTALRETARNIAAFCSSTVPIVVCSKGVEEHTAALPLHIFEEVLGAPERLAVLSGPNHAEEVIQGMPSATVVASENDDCALFFQKLFASPTLRVYNSSDCTGVELCAASKNVIAIATGISYGLGYGDNAAAALMTRGLAEMSRLVQVCGGQYITCMGLAGMGDLIVTCSSRHSRNRRLGELIAHGGSLQDFIDQTHMVAEGAVACKTLFPLAQKYQVEMPITDMVRSVLWEGEPVGKLVEGLLQRPLTSEFIALEE